MYSPANVASELDLTTWPITRTSASVLSSVSVVIVKATMS
jgi:hypothetical protein